MQDRPSPLRVRRLLCGLRLRDLESLTGIPETTLSRLERGWLPLEGARLDALAGAYATPPERLAAEMQRWARPDARAAAV